MKDIPILLLAIVILVGVIGFSLHTGYQIREMQSEITDPQLKALSKIVLTMGGTICILMGWLSVGRK